MPRVREVLSSLNSKQKSQLQKLLPEETIKVDNLGGSNYPLALLSVLPPDEKYSIAGHITEQMLRVEPSLQTLLEITYQFIPPLIQGPGSTNISPLIQGPGSTNISPLTPELLKKVSTSKTTSYYLQSLQITRQKILEVAKGELLYDQVVGGDPIEGHPDIRTAEQIFEVKMTGQVEKNWLDFKYQLFAYASLAPESKEVYLVLPLQRSVCKYDLSEWDNRNKFKETLESFVLQKKPKVNNDQVMNNMNVLYHIEKFQIGSHLPKLKSLVLTVQQTPPTKPMQIFLGNPQSTKVNITDAELAAAYQVLSVSKAQVYIHSPYIINLCSPSEKDSYQLDCLIKNLKYGAAMGAKGVVVHVGKYTKQDPEEALTIMMENLLKAAEEATPDCPLLLETPAGQGTELLTKPEDFVGCVKGLDHPNLKICVDTCHTFACGHNPLTYIQNILTDNSDLLKLIHYNDSKAPCGSRVDRHAFCGTGEIGFVLMEKIAKVCSEAKLPMVIE